MVIIQPHPPEKGFWEKYGIATIVAAVIAGAVALWIATRPQKQTTTPVTSVPSTHETKSASP
jgi:hypothetical protein